MFGFKKNADAEGCQRGPQPKAYSPRVTAARGIPDGQQGQCEENIVPQGLLVVVVVICNSCPGKQWLQQKQQRCCRAVYQAGNRGCHTHPVRFFDFLLQGRAWFSDVNTVKCNIVANVVLFSKNALAGCPEYLPRSERTDACLQPTMKIDTATFLDNLQQPFSLPGCDGMAMLRQPYELS